MTAVRKGIPVVLSGPSGVGKSTICRLLLEQYDDIGYSISATTRQPREGEVDGLDYHFVDHEKFNDWIRQGELIEYAEVYGQFYGTPKESVERVFKQGLDVLLDIDVQGGENIKEVFPESVLVFLLPPSFEELKRRLVLRKTDEEETIARRLEQVQKELESLRHYDYVVVNESLTKSIGTVRAIIVAERYRRERHLPWLRKSNYDLLSEGDSPVAIDSEG